MKSSLSRAYTFSASHRLHVSGLGEAENARLYGKCNNSFGHGHDYILAVTVEGPVDPRTGLLMRRSELDALVSERVLSLFAHRNINSDVPRFADLVPTTENISAVIADVLAEHWNQYVTAAQCRLARVQVQETARNGFEIRIRKGRSECFSKQAIESVIVNA